MSNSLRWLAAAGMLCVALATPVVAQPRGGNTHGPIGGGSGVGVEHPETNRPQRRYIVTAVRFEAIDETGVDAAGSDEIATIFYTPDYKVVTATYGDIDSDDDDGPQAYSRRENCIMPAVDGDFRYNHRWSCRNDGVPGPLAFSVAMYEEDPRSYVYGRFCFDIGFTDILGVDDDICQDDEMHELIGRSVVNVPFDVLNALAVGRKVERTIEIAFGCDQTTSGTCGANDPIYHFTYAVTRVPDVP
jgi:hypothetical protein